MGCGGLPLRHLSTAGGPFGGPFGGMRVGQAGAAQGTWSSTFQRMPWSLNWPVRTRGTPVGTGATATHRLSLATPRLSKSKSMSRPASPPAGRGGLGGGRARTAPCPDGTSPHLLGTAVKGVQQVVQRLGERVRRRHSPVFREGVAGRTRCSPRQRPKRVPKACWRGTSTCVSNNGPEARACAAPALGFSRPPWRHSLRRSLTQHPRLRPKRNGTHRSHRSTPSRIAAATGIGDAPVALPLRH